MNVKNIIDEQCLEPFNIEASCELSGDFGGVDEDFVWSISEANLWRGLKAACDAAYAAGKKAG